MVIKVLEKVTEEQIKLAAEDYFGKVIELQI